MSLRLAILFVACSGLTACAAPALATEISSLPTGPLDLVSYAIATAVCVVVAFVGERLFGLKMDQGHRASLHSALTTGASLVVAFASEMIARGASPTEARQFALDKALSYVRQAAPDPIARFKLADNADLLIDMLKAKEVQLRLAAAPPAIDMPVP